MWPVMPASSLRIHPYDNAEKRASSGMTVYFIVSDSALGTIGMRGEPSESHAIHLLADILSIVLKMFEAQLCVARVPVVCVEIITLLK